jgi:hypothetical protein
MDRSPSDRRKELLSELERKYFWWEPIGPQPRTASRILAQAMELASFADMRQLEAVIGPQALIEVMREAEPGWIGERSWDLWRGRLSLATGQKLPEQPPRRALHAAEL